ncbi:MAG TPA: serine/threonine-protein kinase, partial [Burkholderiaceae bacterium]|nr:serine/threonine-protein kinase [Burkholderiaceae bacterium]
MKKPNQFGKYYLFDRINVGGMAEIYRAKTFGLEGSERLVVVKKMIPLIADDRELVSMFIDEAKLVVQLNHPNIGQVSDWGKVDESYYIAMEYIAGRDLRSAAQRCKQQVIDGSPTMPLAQGCFIVMKLCEALDYAHNKKDSLGKDLGLVHRDVSPANVMISFEGEVKLIDFGVAKIESAKRQETEAGVLKGKFGYLSPEQVRGEKLDRRSDIFSTGIVLYELLTAERLFPPDNDLAVLDRIKNVEVLPPTAYNRKIPEELERIVMKALAPAVADRYQTAMDLHADLQAFLYTSGEFFSRKELAAWMKRVFRAEQEQEQQELDAVREFRAAAPASGSANEPLARARATMSMAALRVPEPSAARV